MTNRREFLQLATGNAVLGSLFASFNAARARFQDSIADLGGGLDSDIDVQKLRQQYSLDPKVVYLNHASIGAMPIPVQEARSQYLKLCEENPWLYMWGGQWEAPREQVRTQCASLLGCDSSEIAITHNTTELFNTLALGLPLSKGDEVLFSTLNHSGASVAFEHAANQRGYTARQFTFPLENSVELTADKVVAIYEQQITPATRVLVFPHIDNTIGVRHPIRELAKMARGKGVEFVAVDGAQSVGTLAVNVRDSGVDVYSTSGHKWLGAPKGTGIGFVSRRIHEELLPMWVSWGQSNWHGSARIYEDYGTRNLAEVLALGDAIEFHTKIGNQARENRLGVLREHLLQRVSEIESLKFNSPRVHEHGAAVVSVGLTGGEAKQVAKHLFQAHQIVVRPFQSENLNAIRISPNVFTQLEELDKIIDLLAEI